jgi:integrase
MATVKKIITKEGIAWNVDYYDPQGRRIKKRFKKKADAEAYLAKGIITIKEEKYEDIFEKKKAATITFDELADHYEENYCHQRSFYNFKKHHIKTLRKAFGPRLLSKITYLDLEKHRNKRKATLTFRGQSRSYAQVNRELSVLKHMLNKAVEWGMLDINPFKRGGRLMFKEDNHMLRFLSEDEIEALLDVCPPHLKAIVETALLTGMRKEELLSLKWEQISHGLIHLIKTKSGHPRHIPISGRLAEIFQKLRHKNQLKSPYIFCDSQGRRFDRGKTSFTTACRKAGIENFRFHDLRHTFASHLIMRGAGLKPVQELLGHSDIKMTMRYAHLSPGHLQDSINLLNTLGARPADPAYYEKIKNRN